MNDSRRAVNTVLRQLAYVMHVMYVYTVKRATIFGTYDMCMRVKSDDMEKVEIKS